jgi:hypothetical protein
MSIPVGGHDLWVTVVEAALWTDVLLHGAFLALGTARPAVRQRLGIGVVTVALAVLAVRALAT